jgi:hypothetical protein
MPEAAADWRRGEIESPAMTVRAIVSSITELAMTGNA